MMRRISRLNRTAFGCGLAISLVVAAGLSPALAEDDEELTFEQKIIHNLLGGSSGPGIDYRERSPLVIPPSTELPPPDNTPGVQGNAAWPHDPDQQRAPSARRPFNADEEMKRSARGLSPRELRRGARASSQTGPVVTQGDAQMGRPLTPSELGETRSLFGLMRSSAAGDKPVAFTHEPDRTRLTQPPPGYQTPSQSQPYAPPKSTGLFSVPSFLQRSTPSNDR
jgi:hypothetical protein